MVEKLKTPSAIFFLFFIVLFAAAAMNIDDALSGFVRQHYTTLLVFTLFLASILLLAGIRWIGSGVGALVVRRFHLKELESRLKRLSAMEKYVLSLFVSENKMERGLDPDEGAVAWLESIKLITAVGMAPDGKRKNYRIAPFAMKVLTENPNLLH